MCMDVLSVCMSVYHVPSALGGPVVGVIDGWELPCGCENLEPSFLEEPLLLLTTEAFL